MPLIEAARVFNLTVLKRVVSAAALAGVLAGSLLTVVQQIQVIPVLLKAELFEESAAMAASRASHADSNVKHDHEAWRPASGWERTLSTGVANVVLAIGFALLLGALICLRGKMTNWRSGLLWGLAGYAVFFVAPSLGLPPEVPGTETARLADRQIWWLLAVACTGTGLWLLLFTSGLFAKLLGTALLAVPHLIGAPQPQIQGSVAPADLAHAFIYASIFANAVFWLLLGGLLGFFYKKLA